MFYTLLSFEVFIFFYFGTIINKTGRKFGRENNVYIGRVINIFCWKISRDFFYIISQKGCLLWAYKIKPYCLSYDFIFLKKGNWKFNSIISHNKKKIIRLIFHICSDKNLFGGLFFLHGCFMIKIIYFYFNVCWIKANNFF